MAHESKRTRSLAATLALSFGLAAPALAGGSSAATTGRPIQEFVDAQNAAGCLQFNFGDPSTRRFMDVDYAGSWNSRKGLGLPTTFDGLVTERPLKDGTTLVHVLLRTDDALAWVTAIDRTPLFGYSPDELLASPSLEPGLAHSLLKTDFVLDQPPGGPLPCLFAVENELSFQFVASAHGALRAGAGVEEGTPGGAQTTQVRPRPQEHYPVQHINLQVDLP